MTINELFAAVFTLVVELVVRIVLAFVRTFTLVMEGRLGDLVLLDLGIITATVVFGFLVVGAVVMSDRATDDQDRGDRAP